MTSVIYLDNAATTKPSVSVNQFVLDISENDWGNPSSGHSFGVKAASIVEDSRKIIAQSLMCLPEELIFTSGATESINTALNGTFEAYPHNGRHMITSSVEHMATLNTCKALNKKGIRITYIPVDKNGKISLESLGKAVCDDTALLSFMHVNNETGMQMDINQLVDFRNKHCPIAKIHIDSAQSIGKIPYEYGQSGVDYASFSAHKIHGPKGVGLLFKSKKSKLTPLILGGGQQDQLRSGTLNTAGIGGFSLAIQEAYTHIEDHYQLVSQLKELFLKELNRKKVDFIQISPEDSSPYILNIAFRKTQGEVLSRILEESGIYISIASACASRKKKASHVLNAMKINHDYIDGAIRISFSHLNTMEEIRFTVEKIFKALEYFR